MVLVLNSAELYESHKNIFRAKQSFHGHLDTSNRQGTCPLLYIVKLTSGKTLYL